MSALRDIDFVGVDPATMVALEELARMEHLYEQLRAQKEQEEWIAAHPELNALEGLGQVNRVIDGFAFHDWAQKFQTYDCWKDKGFNRYIDRIAPETKPKARGTKPGNGMALQVGWTPPNKPRFSKTYGESKEAA